MICVKNWTVQTTNLPSSELLISCHFSFCIKKMLNNLAHVPYHNFFPFVLHFNGKCYLAFWLNTSPCQGLHARLIFRGGHSGLNKYNMFNIVIINLTISKLKKSNSVPILGIIIISYWCYSTKTCVVNFSKLKSYLNHKSVSYNLSSCSVILPNVKKRWSLTLTNLKIIFII